MTIRKILFIFLLFTSNHLLYIPYMQATSKEDVFSILMDKYAQVAILFTTMCIPIVLMKYISVRNCFRVVKLYDPNHIIGRLLNDLRRALKDLLKNSYEELLFNACILNNKEVVEELLKFPNLNINKKFHYLSQKHTALYVATLNNNQDLVRLLLRSPKIDIMSEANNCLESAFSSRYINLLALFFAHDSIPLSIIEGYIQRDEKIGVDFLSGLKNNLTIDLNNDETISLIHKLSLLQKYNVVSLINHLTQDKNIDIYHLDKNGRTFFVKCFDYHCLTPVSCIEELSKEKTINFFNYHLQQAAKNTSFVSSFSNAFSLVETKNFIDFCLGKGASLNTRNQEGKRPFDIAEELLISSYQSKDEHYTDMCEKNYSCFFSKTSFMHPAEIYYILKTKLPAEISIQIAFSHKTILIPPLIKEKITDKRLYKNALMKYLLAN